MWLLPSLKRLSYNSLVDSLSILLGIEVLNAGRQEFELIESLRLQTPPHDRVRLGIGDDAAAVTFPKPSDCLVTVDMLTEGVHFLMPPATPTQVGHKALAVNLSDIAAMAGRPLAAFLSWALPRGRDADLADGLYQGMQALAEQFDVSIAGGDTNSWDGPLVISITLLGEATERGAVTRSGAKPGDWLLVTGDLGGSLSGKHLDFQPRVNEALALHRAAEIHAMIDLSDGLASDLAHIARESGVGALLQESAIPISAAARNGDDERASLERALGDGEDFELLLALPKEAAESLLQNPPIEIPLTKIGEITDGSTLQLQRESGEIAPLPAVGWKHSL